MQSNGKQPILSSGVDYLRLTVDETEKGFDECFNIWRNCQAAERELGHTVERFGFEGFSGHMVGSFFYGLRGGELMCQVSGNMSNLVMEKMRGFDFEGNITRLDAEATAHRETAKAKNLEQLRNTIKRGFAASKKGAPKTLEIRENSKGQDTLYVGSRDSGSFIRVYNATARHSQLYGSGAWRYEVQYNKETAKSAFRFLKHSAQLTSACKQLVVGKLQRAGLKEPWHKGIPPMEAMRVSKKTDDEGRLMWLKSQVAPTVKGLVDRGHAFKALQAVLIDEGCIWEAMKQDKDFCKMIVNLAGHATDPEDPMHDY